MNTTWKTGKLSDLVIFQRGFDITKVSQSNGDIPIISSSGITSFHNVAKQTGPAIIIGRKGTLGSVYYYDKEYWPHDTTLWSKELKGYPKFVYYLLKILNLAHYDVGNANPTLNRNHIHKLDIRIPSLEVQQKIARILSAYDDLIENNLKRIKLLEEMAQITYEEWFVRMKFPGNESIPIDSATGLPVGWSNINLGDYIKFHKGKKLDEIFDNQVPNSSKILLLDSLENGAYKYALSKGHVKTIRGDLIMLMDGARSSWVFIAENGIVGSTISKITSEKIPLTLLYQFFKCHLEWLQVNNTGAAIPHANKQFINRINFKLASDDVCNLWRKTIDPIYQCIWNLKDQNQLLKEARDILLPRLMTGMIDVEQLVLPESLGELSSNLTQESQAA